MRHSAKLPIAVVAILAGLALAGCSTGTSTPTATGPIKIGLLTDLSGAQSLFGPPTKNVAELAVKSLNAAGGINGRKVELVVGDDTSTPTAGVSATNRLISQDGISALFGMDSSAVRDAVAPVTATANIPYFYTALFEGGTCQANMVTNGEVPAQQLATTIPWVQQQTGKNKWFLVGDDYIWGQTVVKKAATYVTSAGGDVVGSELVPLGTTDFTSLITKIKASGANLLMPALVGGDAIAFEKQAYAAGIGNAQIQRLAVLYENATRGGMGAAVADGMYNAMAYDQTIDSAKNTTFLAAYTKEFGTKAPPVTSLSEQTWVAINAWAEAARAAKSTSTKAVLGKVAGITFNGPAGPVTFGSDHYVTQSMYVTQSQPDGSVKVVKTFADVKPAEDCSIPLG